MKKLKKNKNIFILITALAIMSAFAIGIYADIYIDINKVEAENINYTIKYKERENQNIIYSGEDTIPVLKYNDGLYVPIHLIDNMLGMSINYDENSKIIEIENVTQSECEASNISDSVNEMINQRSTFNINNVNVEELNEPIQVNKVVETDKTSLIDMPEINTSNNTNFVKTIDTNSLTINTKDVNKENFACGIVLDKPDKNAVYSKTFELNNKYSDLTFGSVVNGMPKPGNLIVKFVDVDKNVVISRIDVSLDRKMKKYNVKIAGINNLQILVETGDKPVARYVMGDLILK